MDEVFVTLKCRFEIDSDTAEEIMSKSDGETLSEINKAFSGLASEILAESVVVEAVELMIDGKEVKKCGK